MGVRTAYCQLSDVKRLLSVHREKVRFSSSYRQLLYGQNNSGNGRLSGISIDDDYADNESFTITFSDSTNYTLVGTESGYLGDGSIGLTFVSNDGNFTITPSRWSGTPELDDTFLFETNSNISENDATLFLRDSMYFTNGLLREYYGDATNIPFYASDAVTIPQEIELANILYTACMIMQTAFLGQEPDDAAPMSRFCEKAEALIKTFVFNNQDIKGLPKWRSRAHHIRATGIDGVEYGEISGSTDNTDYER